MKIISKDNKIEISDFYEGFVLNIETMNDKMYISESNGSIVINYHDNTYIFNRGNVQIKELKNKKK